MPSFLLAETVPDGVRVRLTCDALDASNTAGLVDALVARTLGAPDPNLFLDLGAVDYLSSAVLGQLLVLSRRLRDAGGQLALFNLRPAVAEVLRASLLIDLLDVRGVPLPAGGQSPSPRS